MLATLGGRPQGRDAKAELNRRSQACEVLTGTGISRRGKWPERRVTLPLDLAPEASAALLGHTLKQMVEHQGSAPGIPVCKTGVYLSTSIPGEMESRAGIAPASAVLQTAACAARPTGWKTLKAVCSVAEPLTSGG